MERVGLLGWPVGHSVSPAMHNAAFAALGLDGWRYERVPVPPEQLAERLGELAAAGWRGFNVTVPHKQAVWRLPQVAQVDPVVEAIGAANTLTVLTDGQLEAANTDVQGFADDLRAHGVDPAGMHCLLLGSGGAARAVRAALEQMGADRIIVLSRRPSDLPGVLPYSTLPDLVKGQPIGLIVNCTPVGMAPRTVDSPWPDGLAFPPGAILYDLIYNPPVTRLMAQARDAGLTVLGGPGMLARQGALSFARWTSISPPLDVMLAAAEQALADEKANKTKP